MRLCFVTYGSFKKTKKKLFNNLNMSVVSDDKTFMEKYKTIKYKMQILNDDTGIVELNLFLSKCSEIFKGYLHHKIILCHEVAHDV